MKYVKWIFVTDKEGNKAVHYVREHCLAQLKPILK